MNEDTIDSTRRLDPEEEPVPDVAPPPLPQDDVVTPPPILVESAEVEPATVVITPSVPAEPVGEPVEVIPSPFDAAEEPGVVTPAPVTPTPVTAAPVSAVGTVVGEPPKKKNNTVLIVVIVAAVLLLLCCCCIIVLAALGGPLQDVMQDFNTMWLGGLSLPTLR